MSALVPAEDILWLDDQGHILLVAPRRGTTWRLDGSEAALWTWLHQGHTYAALLRLLQALLDEDAEQCDRRLSAVLGRWHTEGIVEDRDG